LVNELPKIQPLEQFYAKSLICFLDYESPSDRHCIVKKVTREGKTIDALAKPVVEVVVKMDNHTKITTFGFSDISTGVPAMLKCEYNPFLGKGSEALFCEVETI